MNIQIGDDVDIRSLMEQQAIFRLANDINGKEFAASNITEGVDPSKLSLYVVSIVIAALQILNTKDFVIFMTYYGIGVKELSVYEISKKMKVDELHVATVVTTVASDITKLFQ